MRIEQSWVSSISQYLLAQAEARAPAQNLDHPAGDVADAAGPARSSDRARDFRPILGKVGERRVSRSETQTISTGPRPPLFGLLLEQGSRPALDQRRLAAARIPDHRSEAAAVEQPIKRERLFLAPEEVLVVAEPVRAEPGERALPRLAARALSAAHWLSEPVQQRPQHFRWRRAERRRVDHQVDVGSRREALESVLWLPAVDQPRHFGT